MKVYNGLTKGHSIMLGFKASAIMLALMMAGCDSDDTTASTTSTSTDSSTSSLTYNVVDTGQVDCYDELGQDSISCEEGSEFYGQDATFTGAAFDFEFLTDDDGEIIYETKTYDNDVEATFGAVVIDNNTGLMWEGVPSNERLSYEEAEAYVESLNTAEFQGYTDWRMPTMKELYSIADFSIGWPYLDMDFFTLPTYIENDYDPIDFDAKDEQYWSQLYVGNTYEAGDSGAFGLNHGTGHIKVYSATTTGTIGKAIRAVRGTEDVYGVNNLTINESEQGNTVTDSSTGLMWTQNDASSGDLLIELNRLIAAGIVNIDDSEDATDGDVGVVGLLNWEDALAFANSAEFGGHSDWRLPSIKELQTIFDYEHAPTAGFYRYNSETDEAAITEGEMDTEVELGGPAEGEMDSEVELGDLTEGEMDTEVELGGPTESTVAYTWYDGCDATIVENVTDSVYAATGEAAQTATDEECAARGPAIDEAYFVATSLNDILSGAVAANVLTTTDELYQLYNTVTVQAGLNDYGYYWSSTSTRYGTDDDDLDDNSEDNDGTLDTDYAFAWYAAVGTATNDTGEDYHGAGAIRYDVKDEDSGAIGEDAERIFNFVRLVRDID